LNLLLAPIRSYVSIFTALALPHYVPLLSTQSYPTRRAVATEVIKSVLTHKTAIASPDNLDRILQVLKVLIKEGVSHPTGFPAHAQRRGETDETIEEQGWLARMVHLIQSPDNDTQLKVDISLNMKTDIR
jgi:vacuolar protein sorting-associated protein 35